MSHDHEDRVAQQDPCKCSAYGCPMPGSMSRSTQGTSEWNCWLHIDASMGNWQRISAELNRMGWLVHAITSMRRDYRGKREVWAETFTDALQVMRAAQRGDLVNTKDETMSAWFGRLDSALRHACFGEDHVQPQLVDQLAQQPAGSFQKVGFEMPA
jgi:hypothetical protein